MKKILIVTILLLLSTVVQAGTWVPMGTLPGNCAIFTMTGTLSGDVLIADYNSTLQKKSAGSNVWTPSGLSGRKVRFLTTTPDGDIYAVSGTGAYIVSSTTMIHRSTDNGATWQDLFTRNFPYSNAVGGAMSIMRDGSYLIAFPVQKGPTIGDTWWSFIYKSTDRGNIWFAKDSVQLGAPNGMVTAGEDKVIMGTTEDGEYYSTAGGNHWWPVDTTSHFFGTRYTVNIVKCRAGTIYAAQSTKIKKSTNDGISFQTLSIPSGANTINAICAVNDNEVYYSTADKKVYVSTDGGNTWQTMTTGLPANAIVYSLAIIDNKLYAGTYSYGVYYYEPDAVSVSNGNETAPGFTLEQNYPNPFNPVTKISFSIPKSSFVNLSVYDINGRKVASLLNETKTSGSYDINFDASNIAGGIYFYKLQTDGFSETKKMILTK